MKKPKPGKLPLPHIQYTQDALGRIGHDIERRKRAGEKFPTYEEFKRRRDAFDKGDSDDGMRPGRGCATEPLRSQKSQS